MLIHRMRRVSRFRWVGISTVSRVRFRIRVNVSFKMIHASPSWLGLVEIDMTAMPVYLAARPPVPHLRLLGAASMWDAGREGVVNQRPAGRRVGAYRAGQVPARPLESGWKLWLAI